MDYCQFLRSGTGLDPAVPAVITDAIAAPARRVVVVHVVNCRRIHVGDRAVVVQVTVIPISPVIATARVSKSVIDAAVESDVRRPVAGMPMIVAVCKAPPRRRPQRADIGREHPRARHPIVAAVRVAPVAGCPNVIVAWGGGLIVIWKRRRRLRSLNGLLVRRILIVALIVIGGAIVIRRG